MTKTTETSDEQAAKAAAAAAQDAAERPLTTADAATLAAVAEPTGEPSEQEVAQVLAAMRTGANIPSGYRLNFDKAPYPKVEKIPDAEMKRATEAFEREQAESDRLAEEDAELVADVAPSHQMARVPRRSVSDRAAVAQRS